MRGEREEGDDADWLTNQTREEKGETIGLARVARQGATHKGSRNLKHVEVPPLKKGKFQKHQNLIKNGQNFFGNFKNRKLIF